MGDTKAWDFEVVENIDIKILVVLNNSNSRIEENRVVVVLKRSFREVRIIYCRVWVNEILGFRIKVINEVIYKNNFKVLNLNFVKNFDKNRIDLNHFINENVRLNVGSFDFVFEKIEAVKNNLRYRV